MKKIMSLIFMCITMHCVFAMGQKESDLSSIENWENITIKGDFADIVLTGSDILSLEHEEMTTKTISSSGDVTTVELTVVSVADILNDAEDNFKGIGIDIDDYVAVKFTATDGYVMTATAEEFKDTGIYIILTHSGDVQKAPRSCIPEKRTMYWVKNLLEIEFIPSEEKWYPVDSETTTVLSDGITEVQFFFENVAYVEEGETEQEVPATTVRYNGSNVAAYSLEAYFDEFIDDFDGTVTLVAADGFSRLESTDELFDRYVSTLGGHKDAEDGPVYFKEGDMGQKIKQLEYILAGDTAIYFGNGKSISDIFADVDMAESPTYSVESVDGWGADIPSEAMPFGNVYIDGENGYRTSFGDYDLSDIKGKGRIKNLGSIYVSE